MQRDAGLRVEMLGFDGVAEFGVVFFGPGDGEGEAGEEVVDDCRGVR